MYRRFAVPDGDSLSPHMTSAITSIHGERIPVEIRSYRQSTRYCPTTADAVAIASITHAVYRLGGDWIFRGNLAECRRFITDRQTAEQTRAIAGVSA